MTETPAQLWLVELDDADFDWILSSGSTLRHGLALAPGGLDEPATIEHVRRLTRRLHAAGRRSSWMAVVGGEVVGMIGQKTPPSADGAVEIGYGIAASRRGRGYASQAVAALLAAARHDALLRTVTAETAEDNLASQRVLTKNGFVLRGRRVDPEDGPLVLWRVDVSPTRDD